MPWKDLGEVVGKNGTIGNVDSTYVNNGGEPGVSVTKSGDDSAPDLTFEFENLVNDPLTSSEIEQISNDTQLTSSSVLNGTGLTTLWSRIKAKFAPKSHTHDASDITAGQLAAALIANGTITADMLEAGAVTTAKIADGTVTATKLASGAVTQAKIADGSVSLAKCDSALRDSVSQKTKVIRVSKTKAQWGSGSSSTFTAPEVDGWKFSHWGPTPVAEGFSAAMCYSSPESAASNVWNVYCKGWDSVTAVHCFAVYNRQA